MKRTIASCVVAATLFAAVSPAFAGPSTYRSFAEKFFRELALNGS